MIPSFRLFLSASLKRTGRNALPLLMLLGGVTAARAQKAEKFFNKADLMLVGSYYYPEQWPENNWERDIKKMGSLGFDFTHYGEFAWAAMEPEEGKYNFAWLDKAVELAGRYNLKVVMCTPSPTPPAWLSQKHPEILMVNDEGITMQHGARQHISWSSPVYRQYVEKIVTVLAKRYGNNKAVFGWQIDNEPSHYGTSYDYSPAAQKRFQEWLKKKYVAIDTLNKAWGAAFWSVTYNNFEQIRIPNPKEMVAQADPHAVLDFKRFTADEAADFVLFQQTLLRKYISANQWVTTNLMPEYGPVDPRRMAGLDFPTYTKYLVAGFDMGHGEQGYRMGSSTSIGFSNDFFRPITGVTGVMELQPGQVNWGQYNPQTMPGSVRMWIYHVFAGGNKLVCNYRFRQPLYGGEQYHYGIMKPNGTDVSRSGEEYVNVIGELKTLKKAYDPKAAMPADYAKRKTAILYNVDNRWETEYQPQTNQWDFMTHVKKYYKVLQSFGAPVDVIDEQKDFSAYPVLLAPAYQLLDAGLVEKWKKYVEGGGHLVLSSRTGQKDREGHLWEALFSQPIHQLTGVKEVFYDLMPESRKGTVRLGDATYAWNNWADILEPAAGTEVWASYDDQFYKGKAAVVTRRLGKGTVTYIGPDTDDGKLEADVLQRVYQRAGIGILNLPEGVVVQWTNGFWVGLNYSSQNQALPVPAGAKILIGEKELKPAGVVIWKD
ncbi:beta-galactosidase [Paraflavisolibacter sp. H34]|uniref:beta-galactosidase n=1 Tax=Huijunlia imazamoxiresistens TaxID=3127457 RepID=UPI00301804DF